MNMTLHKYNAGDFTLVPNSFLDDDMILANGEFVKIYLYLLRHSSCDRELSLASIADTFERTESDVARALHYWEKRGLLRLSFDGHGELTDIAFAGGAAVPAETVPAPARSVPADSASGNSRVTELSGREPLHITLSADRKKELSAQEDIRQLIFIAEQYLGKTLSSSEITSILYFYDELHFSADLIEYLIEYCVSKGKTGIHYIRRVALEWSRRGITTVKAARADTNLYNREYYAVLNAFGIKNRGPAQSEADFMARWFKQFGFSSDIVLEACRRTIDRTHTPNFQYADKILESWKEAGVKRFSDIASCDRPADGKTASAPAKAQKRPARSVVSSNRFNNFPQRDYDFDKLEQQLLDC